MADAFWVTVCYMFMAFTLYKDLQRPADALTYGVKILKALRHILPDDHFDIGDFILCRELISKYVTRVQAGYFLVYFLYPLYHEAGKIRRAVECLCEALRVFHAIMAPTHPVICHYAKQIASLKVIHAAMYSAKKIWAKLEIARKKKSESIEAREIDACLQILLSENDDVPIIAFADLWNIVLAGAGGKIGDDVVEGLLGGDGEEGVKAGLEGMSAGVSGSEGKQRAYVERFGVGRVVGLLGHGSAGVQAKACDAIRALTNNCASNRAAFREGGVVERLVRLLSSDARKQACGALWGLLNDCPYDSANIASARESCFRELQSSDAELVKLHVSAILEQCHLRMASQALRDDVVVAVIQRTVLDICSTIDANSRAILQNLSLFMLQNFVVELPADVFPRIARFGREENSNCCLLLSNLSIVECNARSLASHDDVLSYLLDNFKSVPASDSRWLDSRSEFRWALTAFVNLSQWPQCRPRLLAAGVGDVMANLLVEGFVMEPMVIIALAFLYGSNEISVGRMNNGISTVLASRPAALLKLVDCLDTTLQNKAVEGFAYGAFQINTLVCALEQLALSDSNKAHLATPRVVALVHRALFMFTSGAPRLVGNGSVGGGGEDVRSAEAAVSIMLQLSFTSDDVDVLEQNLFPPSLSLLSCLEAFVQSTKTLTDDSRRCARLLISRLLRPLAAAVPLQPIVASIAAGSRTRHVMFSYCWAQSAMPENVRALASMLKASHGVETWVDMTGSALVGPMAGSTDEVMAAAVEASSHVVVCVSKESKLSPNGRQEGSYARQQEKRGKLKIIYVMMQQQYTTVSSPECVDGWLGIMVADKLW